MGKLKALFDVFRKGAAVANPAAWKAGQITTTVLGGFLMALVYLAKAFGHELPIDADTATAVAGGIVAGVNVILTISTSKHVGLPGLQPTGESVPGPVPVPQESPGSPSAAPGSAPVSRFDDATRQRAEEFLRARRPLNPADAGWEAP